MKIQKIWDGELRKAYVRSTDGTVNSASDLIRLEEAQRTAVREKYGRLSPSLSQSLTGRGKAEKLKVLVTLKPPVGIVYLDKAIHSEDELKANSLAAAAAIPNHSLAQVLSPYGLSVGTELSAYTAIAEATPGQISRLAFDADVAGIEEYKPMETFFNLPIMMPSLYGQVGWDDLNTLARSAYDHYQTPVPSVANSIRAATFEFGLDAPFISCLAHPTIPVTYDAFQGGDAIHPQVTFTNLSNAAPGARLFHHRAWSLDGVAEQSYLINNGITAMSMSAGWSEQNPGGPQGLVVDDFAYRYPYPVIVLPTGNNGFQEVPGWAGLYNYMLVGNVQDAEFVQFRINRDCSGGATQTRNPNPIYGGGCIGGSAAPNCAGDREVPYIVAPGWAPRGHIDCNATPPVGTGTLMRSNCISDLQTWGTSMSAPTLAGMVANLQGQVPVTMSWPELARAVLLATAKNVTDGEWSSNFDGADGAGVVHGKGAVDFGKAMVSRSPNNSAVPTGFWIGTMYQNDFNGAGAREFNIRIPNPLPGPNKHLRIVLTWDSSPDLVAGIDDLSDIDLNFGTSATNITRMSSSFNSSIEIIDVPVSEITAGGTYKAIVNPWIWRRHPNSRFNGIYAGLVWGFVDNHAH